MAININIYVDFTAGRDAKGKVEAVIVEKCDRVPLAIEIRRVIQEALASLPASIKDINVIRVDDDGRPINDDEQKIEGDLPPENDAPPRPINPDE